MPLFKFLLNYMRNLGHHWAKIRSPIGEFYHPLEPGIKKLNKDTVEK